MRAQLQKIPDNPDASYRVLELDLPRFDAPWHFHPELELTWIRESRGLRHVGDHLERFGAGDLCLIGPNVPHFWQNTGGRGRARAVVVQFREDFLGPDFLARPEAARLRRLLERSRRGLHFPRRIAAPLEARLAELPRQAGLPRLLSLLGLLNALAGVRGARALASPRYAPVLDARAATRLERAFELVRRRFADTLTLPEVARAAAMSPGGFCRYFKRTVGRNFSTYLNEVRVGQAAQLLGETEHTVARIALECGYASLSNFNRRFLELKGVTPSRYRRRSRAENPAPPGGRLLGHEFTGAST